MNKEIIITLSGLNASGKSRMMYILKEFIKSKGFNVSATSIDFKNEKDFDKHMKIHINEAIESLSKDRMIVMREEHLQKTREQLLDEMGDEYIERYMRRKKLLKINK